MRVLTFMLALVALCGAGAAHATFTKIAYNGAELAVDAVLGSGPNDWVCTRDDDTGRIWEIKTDDGGLHDKDKTYTNYDSSNASSNSVGFANAVNAEALCGYGGWRRPSQGELQALYPNIGSGYFPNSPSNSYWSSTHGNCPSVVPDCMVYVDFSNGGSSADWGGIPLRVRLVNTGQLLETYTLSVSLAGWGDGSVNTYGIACSRSDGVTSGVCSAERGQGSLVTLTATPASGSTFTGWGGACSGSGSEATCTLTLDAAKSVTATFYKPTPTTGIVVDPNTPTTLYAGLDGAGVYKKVGAGDWTAINTGLTNLQIKALAIASSGTLYAGSDGGGVFKSIDSGANWAACGAGAEGLSNLNIRALTLANTTLYAGTTAGVFRSDDQCASWSDISTGLPNN